MGENMEPEVKATPQTLSDLLPNANLEVGGDFRRSIPQDSLSVRADLQNVFEDRVQNVMDAALSAARVDFVVTLRTQFLSACKPIEELLELGALNRTEGSGNSDRQNLIVSSATNLDKAQSSIQDARCLDDADKEQLGMVIDYVREVLSALQLSHVSPRK